MVDPVNSSFTNTALRTQSSTSVSRTSQRAAQALLDQLQQKSAVVSVSNKPLATTSSAGTSKPPTNLPRGSLVDFSV